VTTDCNPRYTRLDPRRGAEQAVAEAARNIACVGAAPIAVTDCLNFGNPEKPHVAWQLTEAVAGLASACNVLEVPVVSGNVSLYNESAGRAIAPTPAVGMVGLIEDIERAVPVGFHEGERVVLLGEPASTLSAGEYLAVVHGDPDGPFPRFDLEAERRLGNLLRVLAGRALIRSAQDVSDGGMGIALAECCMAGGSGLSVESEALDVLVRASGRADTALFSEDQARAVVSCMPGDLPELLALATEHAVPALVLGNSEGSRLRIGNVVDGDLAELQRAWEGGFEKLLGARPELVHTHL
jgi:phosphoribosylformylglycinamidine synthase